MPTLICEMNNSWISLSPSTFGKASGIKNAR